MKSEVERVFDEQKCYSYISDTEALVSMKKALFKHTDIQLDLPSHQINFMKTRDGLFLKDET